MLRSDDRRVKSGDSNGTSVHCIAFTRAGGRMSTSLSSNWHWHRQRCRFLRPNYLQARPSMLYLLANNHRGSFISHPDLMKSIRFNINPFTWPMPDTLLALLRQPNLHRPLKNQVRCQLVVGMRFVICVPAENTLLGALYKFEVNPET